MEIEFDCLPLNSQSYSAWINETLKIKCNNSYHKYLTWILEKLLKLKTKKPKKKKKWILSFIE